MIHKLELINHPYIHANYTTIMFDNHVLNPGLSSPMI